MFRLDTHYLMRFNVNIEYVTILIDKQMLTHFIQKVIRIRVNLKETDI